MRKDLYILTTITTMQHCPARGYAACGSRPPSVAVAARRPAPRDGLATAGSKSRRASGTANSDRVRSVRRADERRVRPFASARAEVQRDRRRALLDRPRALRTRRLAARRTA